MGYPSDEEIRALHTRSVGLAVLYFRHADGDSVARRLAAWGARLVSAQPNDQRWTLSCDGAEMQLILVEDYAEHLRQAMEDPETYLPPLLEQKALLLKELGCLPRAMLTLHGYPVNGQQARQRIAELLADHPGLLRRLT